MKSKTGFLLIFLLLTATGTNAQPGFNEPFNPFYVCHANFENSKYFFYGEILAMENLKDVNVNSMMTPAKAVVKVERSFKGQLPAEITLYLGYRAGAQNLSASNKYLFKAVDGKLDEQKVYFTEVVSRPMTDYSAQAVEEVFDGIEEALGHKNDNFVEGAVFARLLSVREVSLKAEDADRLARDIRISQPLADILLEAQSTTDGKTYRARTDEDGKFRIENIPPGSYKIKLDLPADKEQVEPFTYATDGSPCSRKWYIHVMPKTQAVEKDKVL
jgi:hypothetical protein